MKKSVILLFAAAFFACNNPNNNPTGAVSLNDTEVVMGVGDIHLLKATSNPPATEAVVWRSENNSVATVFYGSVTATSVGQTNIIAKIGKDSAVCKVTVSRKDYVLVWEENFDGNSLNTDNWTIEVNGNGGGNQEKQYYTNFPRNLRVEDGNLVIECLKEIYNGKAYTSGRINSKGKKQFKYGKFEARISLPQGQGTWPAFWTLGTVGGWPSCGEIDIMEHIGSRPTMVSHAVHTQRKNGQNGTNWYSQNEKAGIEGNFHTYGIEWEEKYASGDDCIKFFVDGVQTTEIWEGHNQSDHSYWPFVDENFIILNLAIGGTMGGTINDNIFAQPVVMKVDYVKVWQRQ
ncbi:MAG: family 16 glycosylhydrolase [Prevotellaceae bacterium]|nr:family 16 glycosylhydrolase [Prevotellaceae bacterium]